LHVQKKKTEEEVKMMCAVCAPPPRTLENKQQEIVKIVQWTTSDELSKFIAVVYR
jgi:hypothetical protein